MSVSVLSYNTPELASNELGVPESLSTKTQPRLTQLHTQYVKIPCTSGVSFGEGQQMSFQLPTTGYLQASSLTLDFNINLVHNAVTGGLWRFGGSSASCAQLFNRITLSCGSVVIDDIQNYFAYHSMLLESCATPNYSENTANITEGCYNDNTTVLQGGAAEGINFNTGGTTTGPAYGSYNSGQTINFNMNVCLPSLLSSKSFPLYLLQAPMIITFYLNTSNNAFFLGGTTTSAVFTLSQPSLNYYQVCLPKETENSIKETMLATGSNYELNLTGVNSYVNAVQANSSLSYNLSTHLASMNGLCYVAVSDLGLITGNKYFFKPEQQDLTVNSRLYVNNNQVCNYAVNSDDMRLAEWRKSINGIFSSTVVHRYANLVVASGRPAFNANTFEGGAAQTRGFINGFSTRKNSEDNVSMTGTEARSIILNLDRSTSAAATYFIFLFFDRIVSIDGMGRVSNNY